MAGEGKDEGAFTWSGHAAGSVMFFVGDLFAARLCANVSICAENHFPAEYCGVLDCIDCACVCFESGGGVDGRKGSTFKVQRSRLVKQVHGSAVHG